jgi:hypothetical protein
MLMLMLVVVLEFSLTVRSTNSSCKIDASE